MSLYLEDIRATRKMMSSSVKNVKKELVRIGYSNMFTTISACGVLNTFFWKVVKENTKIGQ